MGGDDNPIPGDDQSRQHAAQVGTVRDTSERDALSGEAGFGTDGAPRDRVRLERHEFDEDGGWQARWPAFRHGLLAAGAFVALSLTTYLFHGIVDLRPWVPGEPLPLAKVVTFQRGAPPEEGASAANGGGAPLTPEQARAEAVKTLGADLAANLGPEAVAAGQGGEAVDVPEVHAGVKIAPDELEGVVRTVEDPSGHAMDAFYRSLARSAAGVEGAVTRVAHWGDSTIAADDVTGTLRRRFQKRFGDAGHGFHLVGKGTMPYRHRDVQWDDAKSWNAWSVISDDRKDRRYGFGGILQTGNAGSRALFRTEPKGPVGQAWSRFEVWYVAHPGSGSLSVVLDGTDARPLDVKAAEVEDRWFQADVPDGPHQAELKAGGPDVRVYGVVMERKGPGVVWDSLGIVGARANRLLNLDPGHLAAQVKRRAPDLLVLAFGGNEAGDDRMNQEKYREQLVKVVRQMRAGQPEASCLLLAPLDQGEVAPRGGVRTLPALPKIVESQRAVAEAEGCAFFDTWSAMGGNGAMGRWYKSKPRLGWGDYRHATPAGYEVIGNLVYKGILKGFDEFLDRPAAAAPAAVPPPSPGTPPP